MLAWLGSVGGDLRFALRQLKRSPGFAATAVGVLALGSGLVVAMFTVLDGVLLHPLPLPAPERLVEVQAADSRSGGARALFTQPMIRELREQTRTLSSVAVAADNYMPRMLDGPSARAQVILAQTDPHLGKVLEAKPALGRWLRDDEERPGATKVAVLSDEVWRTVFGADPRVVGKQIHMWSDTFTVVGVMPPSFVYPLGSRTLVWTARAAQPETEDGSFVGEGTLLARLRPGVSPAAAEAELAVLVKRIAAGNALAMQPAGEGGKRIAPRVHITTMQRAMLGETAEKAMLLLCAAIGAIWLLVCLNVTNLLLTRATVRAHEFAIRAALGAARARLVRQFLLETLLLTAAGSAAGLLLSAVAVKLMWAQLDHQFALASMIHVNNDVVLVAAALAVVGALLTGLLPALAFTRSLGAGVALERGLRAGTAAAGISRQARLLRDVLAGVEIALSLALLYSAGLLLRTLDNLAHVPLGFDQHHVISTTLMNPQHAFDTHDVNTAVYAPLLQRLRTLPGVVGVGASSVLPMRGQFEVTLTFHMDAHRGKNSTSAAGRLASPGFADTLGMRMLRGRFFTDSDTASSPPVAVVNQAFARQVLHGADPVGHIVHWSKADTRIVGEIDDAKQGRVDRPVDPEIYFPLQQTKPGDALYGIETAFMQFAVRTHGAPESSVAAMREVLHQIAPQAIFGDVETMDEVVANSYADRTLVGRLVEIFAAVAFFVALIGLYGVLSFAVEQRRREIGVRLALGAPRGAVQGMVLERAAVVVLAGSAAGAALGLAGARLLSAYLFQVKPGDAPTLAGTVASMAAVSLAAAWLPARRAAHMDPNEALRAE